MGLLIGEDLPYARSREMGAILMRDIRQDLRERLAFFASQYRETMAAYAERRALLEREFDALEMDRRAKIEEIERERAAVQHLLGCEETRIGTPTGVTEEAKVTAGMLPLAQFLITKVYSHGPQDKDELRSEADLAGYFREGNGRTFHTTLMNITKCGKLIQLPDGRYAYPERGNRNLFDGVPDINSEEVDTLM